MKRKRKVPVPSSEKVLKRKRSKNNDDWIDVKSKVLLNKGKEHVNRKNILIKEKKMGPPCILKCRSKCYEKLNYIDRSHFFFMIWTSI